MRLVNFFCLMCFLLPLSGNAQSRERWMDKPKEDWPQIALVNDVLFKNGRKYEDPTITYAASGFLLDTGKDTVAITAKHILWVARNKSSDKVVINDALRTWKMYPKNNPRDSVVIDRLINEDPQERLFNGPDNGVLQRDWIVFSTKSISPVIQPLRLRESRVGLGEEVYLIGNPYRFKETLTARGTISKIEGSQLFVKFEGPGMDTAFLGGASGSPIIDRNGHLIGIFSNSRMDSKTGKRVVFVNSTDYLKRVLMGVQPLNVDKRPISMYLDSLIKTIGARKALSNFERYIKTEKAYFDFEITYLNTENLVKIGQELMTGPDKRDGIFYFDRMLKIYPDNHLFVINLAKAYVQNSEVDKAIKLLEVSQHRVDPEIKGEVTKLLKEIKNSS